MDSQFYKNFMNHEPDSSHRIMLMSVLLFNKIPFLCKTNLYLGEEL